nr:MAG TPA: hypothetical protein [Caudoviricetes sp.]
MSDLWHARQTEIRTPRNELRSVLFCVFRTCEYAENEDRNKGR